VTDANGKLYEHMEYFPFGETWVDEHSNTLRTPYLFTGKEYDQETGLYYFGARYYDPRTSVWQSADPIDRFGPQSPSIGLNLYQYGLWSPLKYSDPTGRDEMPFLARFGAGAARVWHSAVTTVSDYWQGTGSFAPTVRDYNSFSNRAKDVGRAVWNTGVDLAEAGEMATPATAMAMHAMGAPDPEKFRTKYASPQFGTTLELAAGLLTGGEGAEGRAASEMERGGMKMLRELFCSFGAGTLVLTKEGLKPIESIKEGDYVLARDEKTGEESWKKVLGAFARWHDDALNLTLTNEAGGKTETIIVTSEHPFQLRGKGWTPAGKLKAGRSRSLVRPLAQGCRRQ